MRTYDLLVSANIAGELDFIFSNKAITGIAKLAQRFYIQLLTAYNSNLAALGSGTVLMEGIKSGTSNTQFISNYVSISVKEVLSNMLTQQDDIEYDDEKILSAKVESVTKDKTRVVAKISITTQGKESVTVMFPVASI